MAPIAFTRVSDLGVLPDLVTEMAGARALRRICNEQDVPIGILDHPGAMLLYRDLVGLGHRAAFVTGERSFGLRIGRGLGIADLGLYGQYVALAPDLKSALDRCARGLQFHESFTQVDAERDGEDIRFSYRAIDQGGVGWRQSADAVLCILIDVVRQFAGGDWLPKRIEVSYQHGPWAQDLEDLFPAPVLYDQPAVAIVFDAALLERTQSLPESLSNMPTLADLKRQKHRPPENFVGITYEIIRQRLLTGHTDLDGTAEKIGVGPRSMQRGLTDAGSSFRYLLEQARRERAIDLLFESTFSIADIALSLNYASQTQFTRAFKHWEGMTPGEWAKLHAA
jgi:AraC-like DNA-binding protein